MIFSLFQSFDSFLSSLFYAVTGSISFMFALFILLMAVVKFYKACRLCIALMNASIKEPDEAIVKKVRKLAKPFMKKKVIVPIVKKKKK